MAKRKKIKARQEGFFRNVALVLFFGEAKGTTDAKTELLTQDASKGTEMLTAQKWEQKASGTSQSISFMKGFVQKLRTLEEELQERKKNKQHISSRQQRLSLFLAICILLQA
ncbi:hypothetical protein D3C74_164540 [compost metagenome]